MTANLHFGVFDSLDRSGAPVGRQLHERLELVEAAEAAGAHCYHVAEHHGTPLSIAPSPSVFLAAVAARTSTIRLGPLCYLLPLYDPLRLIEEICMLDQLSGGRLELGLSRGVSPYELGFFGIDAEQSRAIFDEALEVLIAGLTSERLSFHGQRYRYDDVPMVLAPLQQPYPPIWYPTTELASIERIAAQGFNFVGLGPAPRVRTLVDEYWRVWHEHRADPGRLNAHVAEPQVGISRHLLVADTDVEARRLAETAHARWNSSILRLWHAHGDSRDDEKFSWRTATEHDTFIFGSPETVTEKLAQLVAVSGCNYFIFAFAWGSLTHAQSLRSLQLFADEVVPAVAGAKLAAGR